MSNIDFFYNGFTRDSAVTDNYVPTNDSLAPKVLRACGIDYGSGISGGALSGIDIKNMDALTVIRMSLLEAYAASNYTNFVELFIDEDGQAQFKQVGSYSGEISDVYHSINSDDEITAEIETSVQITGKKPQVRRRVGSFVSLISEENGGKVWDTSSMLTNCSLNDVRQYACITFNDPHMQDDQSSGIAGLFHGADYTWPWERVASWVYYLDPQLDQEASERINIKVNTTSSVPILLSGARNLDLDGRATTEDMGVDMGTLVRREVNESLNTDANCLEGTGTNVNCGDTTVSIQLPNNLRYENVRGTQVDNFKGISKVYIVGQKLDYCQARPDKQLLESSGDYDNPDYWHIWISMRDLEPQVYTLNQGIDYAITYNAAQQQVCIQFVNNCDFKVPVKWGGGVDYKVLPLCNFYALGANQEGTGCIFPSSDGQTGYMVQQIWVQAEFNTPSVVIFDPDGNAPEIASNLIYEAAPVIIEDYPQPIAIDGSAVDLTSNMVPDSDPTTTQALSDTDLNRKQTAMDGNQIIDITMATLDEEQIVDLSQDLKTLANKDPGLNRNYLCGPKANPKLGGTGLAGGIVNNITYNYTDMGSYTVSVTEGPSYIGNLTSVNGAPYKKMTETVTTQGRVVGYTEGSAVYEVLLDGVGVREAINSTADTPMIGDQVTVTVYNNPVEE